MSILTPFFKNLIPMMESAGVAVALHSQLHRLILGHRNLPVPYSLPVSVEERRIIVSDIHIALNLKLPDGNTEPILCTRPDDIHDTLTGRGYSLEVDDMESQEMRNSTSDTMTVNYVLTVTYADAAMRELLWLLEDESRLRQWFDWLPWDEGSCSG